ncbi:Intradiol ring-cleavage dioxygenase [Cyathus striatus]|nr:Intradiol ring-cleavage dioxygenase [Cyathus striatus]
MQFIRLFSFLCLLGAVAAHPGELEEHGTPARREFLSVAKRSIDTCQDKIAARGLTRRAVERRSFLTEELRRKRGLPTVRKRDLDTVLSTDHLSDLTGLTADSPAEDIFTGDLNCILQPEVTQGPYYVEAELIRKSAVETQEGLPLYVDIQLLDVNTCEPVTDAYMDLWHCNSTGVYSGVVANGNGDSSDTTNIDATFLRAVQPTDADGVAYFETIFPGHYTSRSTHMHMLVTLNATVLANNTLDGGYVSHVGQAFFDQSLITAVEKLAPYSTNTQEITLNSADQILSEEAASMDPVVKYTLLGDSLADGVIAWITIGINASAEYSVSAASTWTANGGIANENSMGGGGGGDGNGGGPGGNGTAPSGAAPSGGAFPSGEVPQEAQSHLAQ